MTVGRGFCSIEPRKEIVDRFKASGKRKLVLLLVSDFDPDGDEIAESFVRSVRDDFGIGEVTGSKILLRADQAKEWSLPPNAMEAKESSSRFSKFFKKYNSKQVFELEAVAPLQMQEAIEKSIRSAIDLNAFEQEVQKEKQDAVRLSGMKATAKEFFENLDLSELEVQP
jgi:predicted RNA-binding protein with RPS1 domain